MKPDTYRSWDEKQTQRDDGKGHRWEQQYQSSVIEQLVAQQELQRLALLEQQRVIQWLYSSSYYQVPCSKGDYGAAWDGGVPCTQAQQPTPQQKPPSEKTANHGAAAGSASSSGGRLLQQQNISEPRELPIPMEPIETPIPMRPPPPKPSDTKESRVKDKKEKKRCKRARSH